EAAVHAVVLEHVGQALGLQQVVDGNDLDVREVLDRAAQHVAADAAESVDTESKRRFLGHGVRSGSRGGKVGKSMTQPRSADRSAMTGSGALSAMGLPML